MATIADFPELKPSSRAWTPGSPPVKVFSSLSGYEQRVLLGPEPIGTSLALTFSNLLEADILRLTDHYVTAKGTFNVFGIKAETLAGMSNTGGVTPNGQKWRYAGPPQIDWVSPGIGNISVSLVAVPI